MRVQPPLMNMRIRQIVVPFLATFALLATGCSISQQVTPAPMGTAIERIRLVDNPSIHMAGFQPELIGQIQALGYRVDVVERPDPEATGHQITYTANWQWDMAMYLTYFQLTLFENGRVVGTATYDARSGGSRLDKFGPTAEKIRPLLIELFANAQPATP